MSDEIFNTLPTQRRDQNNFVYEWNVEHMKRLNVLFLALSSLSSAALADDIGSVRKKVPEFTASVRLNMFDVERCIIDVDNIGKPWVYRQPDRPNDVMLVWESSDLGDATVLEMHMDGNTTTMKFWGRNKAWRKAQPCIGRKESDIQ